MNMNQKKKQIRIIIVQLLKQLLVFIVNFVMIVLMNMFVVINVNINFVEVA